MIGRVCCVDQEGKPGLKCVDCAHAPPRGPRQMARMICKPVAGVAQAHALLDLETAITGEDRGAVAERWIAQGHMP